MRDFEMPTGENILISPEMAKKMYETSKGNRNLSRSKIEDFARQMSEGKWGLNGETLIFGKDGSLMDGHHRLQAVIKANKPIWFTIIKGVDERYFSTIDSGQSRSSSQVFQIAKVPNANVIASVVSSVEILKNCGRLSNNYNHIQKTKKELLEIYKQDTDGYQEAVSIGSIAYENRLLKKTFVAAIYYYLVHDGGWQKHYVEKFLLAATGVHTTEISQAEALRVAITKMRMAKGQQLETKYAFLMVAKAWNYYVKNQPIKILRIDETADADITLMKNKTYALFR